MKKIFLLNFLVLTSLLYISCGKSDFDVTSSNVTVLSRKEIYGLGIIQKFLTQNLEDSPGIYSEKLKNSISEFKSLYYLKLKGTQTQITVKNNSGEVIESAHITVVVSFKFKNKDFYYYKTNKLLQSSNTWAPNESKIIILNDVFTMASGNTEALNIHKPEKVVIEYYLLAKNSVGYNNVENYANSIKNTYYLGDYQSSPINENTIKSFGAPILTQDITELWHDAYNEENSSITPSEEKIVKALDDQRMFKTYEIQDAFRLSVSVDLELRDDNSEIGKTMNSFKDKYNIDYASKIGKSDLIFQPIGTNKIKSQTGKTQSIDQFEPVTRAINYNVSTSSTQNTHLVLTSDVLYDPVNQDMLKNDYNRNLTSAEPARTITNVDKSAQTKFTTTRDANILSPEGAAKINRTLSNTQLHTNIDRNPVTFLDATRITINYHKSAKSEFPSWNKDLSSSIDSTLNNRLKRETLKAMSEMPFKCELLSWELVEAGFINNQSYLKTSYVFKINENLSFTETYTFFNKNERVLISLTSDFPCLSLWRKAFSDAIKSFSFIDKK